MVEGQDSLFPEARPGGGKSATAFRTISEVAEDLGLPQHVLRFWETKFPQIHPLKRGGGRRYYRPEDVVLLKRIRDLLHSQGYTIKGVQKLLREESGRANGAEPEATPEPSGAIAAPQRHELANLLAQLEDIRTMLARAVG